MNKQEVIQKINDSMFFSRTIPLTYQSECFNQGMDTALKIISKLDEPQKVKVPECVAEYIEAHRKWGPEIFIGDWLADNDAVYKWLYNNSEKENNRRFLIAVKAFVEGYEVEEEPKWVVKKSADRYFKAFNGIDFCSSSVAYEDYACLFADRTKAEAVALLVDGSVEEV